MPVLVAEAAQALIDQARCPKTECKSPHWRHSFCEYDPRRNCYIARARCQTPPFEAEAHGGGAWRKGGKRGEQEAGGPRALEGRQDDGGAGKGAWPDAQRAEAEAAEGLDAEKGAAKAIAEAKL